jgi:hypothetical protein
MRKKAEECFNSEGRCMIIYPYIHYGKGRYTKGWGGEQLDI